MNKYLIYSIVFISNAIMFIVLGSIWLYSGEFVLAVADVILATMSVYSAIENIKLYKKGKSQDDGEVSE